MTEQSKLGLPMSATDSPDLSQMSPTDIVNHLKARYLKSRWPHWQNMGEVSLEQTVWLSFDIEPFGDELDAGKAASGISRRLPAVYNRYCDQLRDALRNAYDQRMKQCIANIRTEKLRASVGLVLDGQPMRCSVSLEDFRQWGESLPAPYTFPDEFPRPAAAGALTATDDEKPLGTRERKTLLRIILALIAIAGERLPEDKETTIIEAQVAALGFDGPKTATILKAVKAAKAEKTDSP